MEVSREAFWQRLEGPLDLLVIGGGATGAGVLWEATLRGLRAALVEARDFASGTSSRSTKLLHGGVRYLELALRRLDRRQLRLVVEALRERRVVMDLAPHLARPLPLLTPLFRPLDLPYYGVGLALYDLLAGRRRLGPSRYLPPRAVARLFPHLPPTLGGVLYLDGQFLDHRLNLLLILSALARGGMALNYAEVRGFLLKGGRVAGAVVRDGLTGKEVEVRAKAVVNAAGPQADGVRRLLDPGLPPLLSPSSGAHLVLDYPLEVGLLLPRTRDGRVLFLLPYRGKALLGTTDLPAPPTACPRPQEAEVAYLLEEVRPYLGDLSGRVRAAWAGLRPLVGQGETRLLVRDHLILEERGLYTLTGGKWTTFRLMAQDLLDRLDQDLAWGLPPSPSHATPLLGTGPRPLLDLPQAVQEHLYAAYGALAGEVAALGDRPLLPGLPYLEGEVVWAVRREMAQKPLDVLARRLGLALLDQGLAERALPRVVALMAPLLGWEQGQREALLEEARRALPGLC
ncbi:FAD-dependent oxidoreductase [Thermus sp.]|uniref:FAD-dependent oxidoreductase n=1 Tax=Thermus sp. TaxID=275 RepID=UPI0025D13F65|nr:FAD-dependent oxidoreductase [Thermus sp.]MCS6868356.1 FAD-dependent oxidoreductase [Thermus sp.]MCX7849745.1 FAD-dependent oxidoreductase [Thermus sp.]MDW8016367.1 FAD-dependent oxidoreductase [Thermus sp.]